MNCRDIDKQIYLYEEISSDARKEVDLHLLGCESCKKKMEEVQQQKTAMRAWASLEVQAKNPARITHNIMRAVQSENIPAWQTLPASFVDRAWMRWSLATVSTFLIIFFLFEQQQREITGVRIARRMNTRHIGSVLNTRLFLEAHKKREDVVTHSPITSLYDCLKKDDCDHAFRKYQKLRRNYENI